MMKQLENNTNEAKNMLWAFTQNNAAQIQKELESIEQKDYDLYVKDKTGKGLLVILQGPDEERLEIDTETLEMISNDVPKETLDELTSIIQTRLTKTNEMLDSIGR